MWRQKSKSEALKDYLEGKKVLCMTEPDDESPELGGTVDLLDAMLEDLIFLVDVKPATVNPEFEAAVQDMVSSEPAANTPPREEIKGKEGC